MRTFSAALITAILISVVIGIFFISLGTAWLLEPPYPPQIHILSPEVDKTYEVSSVVFALDGQHKAVRTENEMVHYQFGFFNFSNVQYWLDGALIGRLENLPQPFSTTLAELSEGRHSVEVTARATWDGGYHDGVRVFAQYASVSSGKIYFYIDTAAPSMPFLSPQNQTYDTVNIPLNFAISEQVLWIGYSLDGEANVTITECVSNITDSYGEFNIVKFVANTVLTGLSEGSHSLTVYAKDTAGNTGESETIHFTTTQETEPSEPEPQPPTFSAALIAAAFVSAAAVGAGLLLFFLWKRNQ